MKHKLFSILFLMLMFSCNLDTNRETENIIYDNTIVCFGDSLTSGYGIGIENSYPSILQEKVNAPVVNSGISGNSTTNALNRVISDVVDKDPLITIIEFGANDLYLKTDPAIVKSNLIKMIDLIKTENNEIFLVRFFNQEMAQNTTEIAGIEITEEYKALISDYYNIYDEIAQEKNIYIIDNFWDEVWGNEYMFYDEVHPNKQGAEIIATNIYNAITPVLEKFKILR